MEAERWQRIEELYHSALCLTAEARQKFLHDTCSDDETLRGEVESLLRHGVGETTRVERPVRCEVEREVLCVVGYVERDRAGHVRAGIKTT